MSITDTVSSHDPVGTAQAPELFYIESALWRPDSEFAYLLGKDRSGQPANTAVHTFGLLTLQNNLLKKGSKALPVRLLSELGEAALLRSNNMSRKQVADMANSNKSQLHTVMSRKADSLAGSKSSDIGSANDSAYDTAKGKEKLDNPIPASTSFFGSVRDTISDYTLSWAYSPRTRTALTVAAVTSGLAARMVLDHYRGDQTADVVADLQSVAEDAAVQAKDAMSTGWSSVAGDAISQARGALSSVLGRGGA